MRHLRPVMESDVQGVLLVMCPESPVWLRWTGDHMAARHVERRLSRTDLAGLDEEASGAEAALLEAPASALSPPLLVQVPPQPPTAYRADVCQAVECKTCLHALVIRCVVHAYEQ